MTSDLTTRGVAELQRRQAAAVAALEDAVARAEAGDAGADLDAERHAEAAQHYAEAIRFVREVADRPYSARGTSWFADLIDNSRGDTAAWSRLKAAQADYRSTSGNFGGLVVPRRLSDRVASSGHGLRPLCDHLAEPLPEDGAPVILSRVTTAATAEVQSAENTAVTADQPATTEATLAVKAVASLVDVSFQLQARTAPEDFDRMVGREVVGAVDALLEAEVVTSLLGTSGVGTYSVTSTAAADFLDALARTSAASHEAAGAPPDTVVMAPRRWRWLLANRGDRAAAVVQATTPGPVAGYCLGMAVIESPSVPLTESTNQDRVLVLRREDTYLGESPATVEVVTDAANGAGALMSRLRARRYFAVGSFRPAGIFVIDGAGLANPY